MANPLPRIYRGLARRADEFLRTSPALASWRIDRAMNVEDITDGSITNLRVLEPAARVPLGVTEDDRPFLEICRHYRDGFYDRPNIFTCEVPGAFCHVFNGLICTRDWVALNDSQMTYRMAAAQATVGNRIYRPFHWFKPRNIRHLAGLHATIGNIFMGYWGHWIFDCLSRLCSLEKTAAGRVVKLIVPDDLPASKCDSLDAVLPANFELLRLPPNSWAQVETMLLASYPSGRANHHLPREFYDYVRGKCFAKFGLPPENRPSERIYVSRAGARHRRITNEDELVRLVAHYGFKAVMLEKLSFREQVELFHRAEVVIAADGSNWADMIFAGPIKIVVLYSPGEPNTHWFTAAKGLGHEHFFLSRPGTEPHADFSVDLGALERIVKDEMRLAVQ